MEMIYTSEDGKRAIRLTPFSEIPYDNTTDIETAQVQLCDDEIVLNVPRRPYHIALERCNSPEKILGWTEHLGHKTWITKNHLIRFEQLAFEQLGVKTRYAF